jgi:SNF2 family DNA or RNA helicase
MLEYIDDCEEQEIPLVVFSAHVKPFDVLRGRPGWAIIDGSTPAQDRQSIVESFQNGLINGVACTIQAGGVGITLTRAWKALFVDQDWVPANNWQAEDRICRIGQTNDKVEIVRFVSNHPIDRRLMELLSNKAELIHKTLG